MGAKEGAGPATLSSDISYIHTIATHAAAIHGVKILTLVLRMLRNFRYDVWFREVRESGFVQQHILRGTLPNGKELAMPVCAVCQIEDGRIVRFDEHLDSAHTKKLIRGIIRLIITDTIKSTESFF